MNIHFLRIMEFLWEKDTQWKIKINVKHIARWKFLQSKQFLCLNGFYSKLHFVFIYDVEW